MLSMLTPGREHCTRHQCFLLSCPSPSQQCWHQDPNERPDMHIVVRELELMQAVAEVGGKEDRRKAGAPGAPGCGCTIC